MFAAYTVFQICENEKKENNNVNNSVWGPSGGYVVFTAFRECKFHNM
jgi:hypothetical protein